MRVNVCKLNLCSLFHYEVERSISLNANLFSFIQIIDCAFQDMATQDPGVGKPFFHSNSLNFARFQWNFYRFDLIFHFD